MAFFQEISVLFSDLAFRSEFLKGLLSIFGVAIFWTVTCRLEYYTGAISQILGLGCRRLGFYAYTLVLFSLLTYRDYLVFLIATGAVLRVVAVWKLGYECTMLGDYFGYLLDTICTSFPFDVSDNPMYIGLLLISIGYSILTKSLVAALLGLSLRLTYYIASKIEGPFTEMIYERAAAEKKIA